MSGFLSYFSPDGAVGGQPATRCAVRGLGIREAMAPGLIRHGGAGWAALLVRFHSPAFVYGPRGATAPAARSFVLWAPGRWHVYGHPERAWDHSWLVFDHPKLAALARRFRLPLGRPVVDTADAADARLLALYEEVTRPAPAPFVVERLLDLLLFDLHRSAAGDDQRFPAEARAMGRYFDQRLADPPTLAEAARHFHCSPSHFIVRFRRYYGQSPLRYLMDKRMGRAAQLLAYAHSCKEVARRVGFADPLLFSRRFRAHWGVSPRQYRDALPTAPRLSDSK